MTRARELGKLANKNSLTADNTNNFVGIGSTQPDARLDVDGTVLVGTAITLGGASGIVSATSFYGDGSNLEGVASAGLGTALAETQPGNVIYYTDNILGIGSTMVVTVPAGSDVAYTQYAEVSLNENVDLIVTEGDDFVTDILGLSTSGISTQTGIGGRIRAGTFTNKAGTGAPQLTFGAEIPVGYGLTGAGGINVSGAATIGGNLNVGGTLTYEDVTNIDSVGIITARSDVSIADKIIHTGDTNTAIRFPAADTFTVETAGSERLRVNSSGNIGINSTIPRSKLHVANGNSNYNPGNPTGLGAGAVASLESSGDVALQFLSSTTTDNFIYFGDTDSATTGSIQYDHNVNALSFNVSGGTERLRIDSAGRTLINTSSSIATEPDAQGYTPALQVVHAPSSAGTNGVSINRFQAGNAFAPPLIFQKSKNDTIGSHTIVANNDELGDISFAGSDGAAFRTAARINVDVDGTPGTSDMPGRIQFSTTADGAATPTERLRIDSSGRMLIGATAAVAGADANGLLQVSQDVGSNTCIIVAENTASSGNLSCFRARLRNSAPNGIFSAFLQCDDSGASKAVIRSNGGLANFSANNVNLSDRNAKKDITTAVGTWNSIKNWEIVNFRYKEQPDDANLNLGVIAQQIEEISPEMVTIFQQAKEATETEPALEQRLGVKEQQMQWAVIKALQEAMARIETLETQNASLEARLTALETQS